MPILVIRKGTLRSSIHAANLVKLLLASFERSCFSIIICRLKRARIQPETPRRMLPKGMVASGEPRPSSRKREPGLATVELLPTGMDPSIHSDVFARYERGVLEIEHRVDDVRNFTH